MNLIDQAKSFFNTRKYLIQEKEKNFLVAESHGEVGGIDRKCIWVLTKQMKQDRNLLALEDEFETRFKGIAKKFPSAELYLLVDSLEGLTADFRNKAKSIYKVRIQVPCQLFDMPFSWEIARQTATVSKELFDESIKCESMRVPQAYSSIERTDIHKDLVVDLLQEIENWIGMNEPRIWFVIAPAGYGKSVLFSSLFGKLFGLFQENKKTLHNFPRPLPLVSSHLQEAVGLNIMGLIDAFMRTEFAGISTREYFNWMLEQQFGFLMIDGLDELISRDPNFLYYLEERILAPSSQPGVLICVRDSLFNSNDDLSEFLEYYRSITRVFSLQPWDQQAKRTHAWIALEGRRPKPGDQDRPAVTQYLKAIATNKTQAALSSIPFYADLLLKTYSESKTAIPIKESELVEVAISQMCEREYDKGTIKNDIFPISAFKEWLEELAVLSYRTGGVSIEDLRILAELAEALAVRELSDEEKVALVDHISMAPFLTRSAISGKIELIHDIFSEYLAAQGFLKEFESNPTLFLSRLSQKDWPFDSMYFAVISDSLNTQLDKLLAMALTYGLSQEGFRNLIQLTSLIKGGDRALREGKLILEGKRLQAIRFANLNLEGVSFRGADLTNLYFISCNLRKAKFEGAILKGTQFLSLPDGGLLDASFGDLELFSSVFIGDHRIEDIDKFRSWLQGQKGKTEVTIGPCPTARQLLFLFHKFIHVDGQARRDILDRRGILRGKQIPNAVSLEDCLNALIEFGYFEEKEHDRIRRASGPKYGEMVAFVKSQLISPQIKVLLDSLCRIPDCKHIRID